jgi:hypothetical protein
MAVSIGEEIGWSFDGEGRLYAGHRFDNMYRRSLGHRIRERRTVLGRARSRELSPEEGENLVQSIQDQMALLLSILPYDSPAMIRAAIQTAAGWSATRYRADVDRFNRIYAPVGILPPDQYLSVLLQATTGCHYNGCTFCDFYRDVPFTVKSKEEFEEHVRAVRALIGGGLPMRKTVFLGDANALATSSRRRMSLMDVVHSQFDVPPIGMSGRDLSDWVSSGPGRVRGIYSFMDAFTESRDAAPDLHQLAERGLRRIYIGAESGHVPLLEFLRKPSGPEAVARLVRRAHGAGIQVAVIVMTGVGGRRYAEGHVDDTTGLVNSLELSRGDIVYLSSFRAPEGSDYSEAARSAGGVPLEPEEVAGQEKILRSRFRIDRAVKVASYDVREFMY